MRISLICLLIFFSNFQLLPFTSSNLPIVLIRTDTNPATRKPYEINDLNRVMATMKLIYRPDGSRNYLTDSSNVAFLNYSGRISIEIRGSTSQVPEKKPYGLTTLKTDGVTNNNIPLLGMPSENDWILSSMSYEPSYLRDFFSYELYNRLGNYSSRAQYCEVLVNGDYRGLYMLLEKIKVDKNRVNVVKMTNTDNAGQFVTGGYITKSDKTTGNDPVAWNMSGTDFIHHAPKPEVVTTQQTTFIKNQFSSLSTAATAKNNSLTNGIPSIIDIPSFVDFMILNEFASNVDGYQFSTYYHKDRGGKLRAGPIWDFNLTYGNDLFLWGFNRSFTNVWQFNDGGNVGPEYWRNLFANATFKCYLSKRWNELIAPGKPLNYNVLTGIIDGIKSKIAEAVARDVARWGQSENQTTNINNMKDWIQKRITWISSNIGSYSACENIAVPSLVISAINYNPPVTVSYQADSLEFVRISNAGNATVNLTGIYFRELGLTYRFPANSTLAAGKSIYIASSAKVFEQFWGIKAFGQFSRNLGNDTENLLLVDGFGNVIDRVNYTDVAPWPLDADGKGPFMELNDWFSDNNNPVNWKSSNVVSDAPVLYAENSIRIYPLPARDVLTVSSSAAMIQRIEITDITGRIVLSQESENELLVNCNVQSLQPNVYLLKVILHDGSMHVRKISTY
jgi:hypothetical protein